MGLLINYLLDNAIFQVSLFLPSFNNLYKQPEEVGLAGLFLA